MKIFDFDCNQQKYNRENDLQFAVARMESADDYNNQLVDSKYHTNVFSAYNTIYYSIIYCGYCSAIRP